MKGPPQVWLFQLGDKGIDPERALSEVSDQERVRAGGFPSGVRRDRWVQRHWCERQLLALYAGCTPQELRLSQSRRGKPIVDHPPGVHFSASEAETIGGIAIHVSPIGFDLEQIDWTLTGRELERQAEFVLSPRELRRVMEAEGEARQRRYYRQWVLKEAFLKATGSGISGTLLPEVDPFQTEDGRDAESSLDGTWRAFILDPDSHHVGVLVAPLQSHSPEVQDFAP